MTVFCPLCGNLLFVQLVANRNNFCCNVCPFVYKIRRTIVHHNFYKLKEIDDVLGAEEAWRNVDSTEVTCPKCSHNRAYFMQLQIRSADEPMTTFYRCCNTECAHNWRD